jgi:hypothetical protein
MAATQHPAATFLVGGQPDLSADNYEVIRWRTSQDYRDENVNDQAGAFKGKLVYERRKITIDFELMCLDGATPATDFIKGALVDLPSITTYAKYYVREAVIESTEGVQRVTGQLVLIDFT